MTWWIFDTQDEAEAAQALAAATIGPDVRDGKPVEPPITMRWADVQQTADGLWAFPAKPGMDLPDKARVAETVVLSDTGQD